MLGRYQAECPPQIVLYVVSRVVSTLLPRVPSSAASATSSIPPKPSERGGLIPPGYPYPKSQQPDPKVFKLYAALAWGSVMWLFANKRERLHGGLVSSMQYLYLDSEVWSGLRNFVWRTLFPRQLQQRPPADNPLIQKITHEICPRYAYPCILHISGSHAVKLSRGSMLVVLQRHHHSRIRFRSSLLLASSSNNPALVARDALLARHRSPRQRPARIS